MLVFIDTEFTDFSNKDLISLALVAQDGRELYAELSDYDRTLSSDFVRAVVEPLLGRTPGAVRGARAEVAQAVRAFLAGIDAPCIAYDYPHDLVLLRELLGDMPAPLASSNVYRNLDETLIECYFAQHEVPVHHALHDARANRVAYRPDYRRRLTRRAS